MADTKQTNRLHIPNPKSRPGDDVDFSDIDISEAGIVHRPAVSEKEPVLRDLPYQLIRTLDNDGQAIGSWVPSLSTDELINILKLMMLNRVFDDRLFQMQRQGKTSFYMKSRGEEAISVVSSLALRQSDMCFPTYRMVGWLMARNYPLIKLVNQIFSNCEDPLQGKQLPVLYSAKDYGFYSIAGNLGTRYGHAVGWSMAKAYRGSDDIAIGFVGDGSTAEAGFHEALTMATVYQAPVILAVTNNQWAISSYSGIAGAEQTTFAAKATAYGIPGLRVDGNDVLAVHAVIDWAAERARAGHGPTLIEFFTYRAEGHSTSDDPSKYRPKDEPEKWPLGDPIERLKQHLIRDQKWSDEQHAALHTELEAQVREVVKEGEAIGVLGENNPSTREMFECVFKEPDWRIIEQRGELGV